MWRKDKTLKGGGEGFRITDGNQEAVAAMPDGLPAPRRIRCDNRTPHRHGFQDRSRSSCAVGWQHVDRGGGECWTNIIQLAQEFQCSGVDPTMQVLLADGVRRVIDPPCEPELNIRMLCSDDLCRSGIVTDSLQ